MKPFAAVLIAATLAALPISHRLQAQSGACNRACLEGFVEQYLDALVAKDFSKLPMTPNVKMTEDGVRLPPGDGFTRSAKSKSGYRLIVADPATNQVAFLATMMEDPVNPVLIASRLKVVNRRVSEIESMIVRNSSGAENLDRMKVPNAAFNATIAAAQRSNRAALIRVANQYYSGIQNNDGKGQYPLADGCERIENGYQTTHNPTFNAESLLPNAPPPPGRGGAKGAPAKGTGKAAEKAKPAPPININALGCKEQFETGYFGFVKRVRDRRFTAVDPERGLVFAFGFMDNPSGAARNVTLKDGRKIQAGPERPFTWEFAEVFKIDGGLIQRVEAILQQVPYGMPSGWSTAENALSSAPQDYK